MATKAADNRYSKVKYAQTKYGPSAATTLPTLAWEVSVDWNGDGIVDTNESRRFISFSSFRGRRNMLKPLGSGFEQMEIGQITITLDNYDHRYDGWNTASPLYPNVIYGRDIRIRELNRNTGVLNPVFYGIISDIQPIGNGTENPQVQVVAQEPWSYLRNNSARVPIWQSITTDKGILYTLQAVNWPNRWGCSLDVSTDTIPYFWATGTQDAGSVCEDLANSGAGTFFINASGKAVYLIRSDVPAASFAFTEETTLKNLSPMQPWMNYRNTMRMTCNPRTLAASGVIWKLSGNSPSVNNGATFTFTANYTYNNVQVPAIGVLQPVPHTDWHATSNNDGTGTDYTENCTLTIVDNGDNALGTFINNSGAVVYLYQPQIIGQAIYVLNTIDVTYPTDPTTVSNPRVFYQNLVWQQDANTAATIVSVLGPFYAGKYPTLTVQMQGRPDTQFALDLFNTVTVTFPTLGISGLSFRIGGIEHQSLSEGCEDVLTTFYLEPYPNVGNVGIWGVSVWDTPVFGW